MAFSRSRLAGEVRIVLLEGARRAPDSELGNREPLMEETRTRAALRRVGWVVGTAAVYTLLDRFGANFQVEEGVSVLFPATAVAIVACMHFGSWGALGVVLGTILNPWTNIQSPNELLLIGVVNAIEGLIPSIVFKLVPDLSPELRDLRSLGWFLVSGTALNTAVSALFGTELFVESSPTMLFGQQFLVWWMADFVAALLLATPTLAFGGRALRRLSGAMAREERRPFTIINALQITAAIVLLGWFASSVVRNVVANRLEFHRLTQQQRSNDARSLINRLHSNFLHAADMKLRYSQDADSEILERFREAHGLHDLLVAELRPLVETSTPAVRDQFMRLGTKTEIWFRDTEASLSNPAMEHGLDEQETSLGREFLNLKASIENADAVGWLDFRKMRARLTIFGVVVDGVVFVILVVAFVTLIRRISKPLEQLHQSIEALGHGTLPPRERTVEPTFVELESLGATLVRAAAELKQRELELQEQTRMAVEASRHKSEFLAKMSHELRTPLNAILGFSDLLREQGEQVDPEKRARFLENVIRSARALLAMINDLLDIAKLESGSVSFEMERVDARIVVQSAAASSTAMFAEKSQKLTQELPDTPLWAVLDREKIEQVLMKLLSNAQKFSDNGSEIILRGRQDGTSTELEVCDNGIGIDPDDQSRIFESFAQVFHRGALSQGAGIGLALAKRFVVAQGGTISVRSNAGRGSTFTIRFPRERAV